MSKPNISVEILEALIESSHVFLKSAIDEKDELLLQGAIKAYEFILNNTTVPIATIK
jgi:hypothetical protein